MSNIWGAVQPASHPASSIRQSAQNCRMRRERLLRPTELRQRDY
ncbi:hypothetical protein ACLEW3_06610 [Escherichia coli]|nr:hypothetical protein [Escherichia coli]